MLPAKHRSPSAPDQRLTPVKPAPPPPQFIIEGAKLPWVNEKSMGGSRDPSK